MRVPVTAESSFSAGKPQVLFEGRYYVDPLISARGRTYDISRDGQRLLMIKDDTPADAAASSLMVVVNWFEELKQRVH